MAETADNKFIEIALHEYDKLKLEQIRRIGFRDNLLYVCFGVYGALFFYAISGDTNHPNHHHYALLVQPWVCLVLGWTYLVNDEKISAIGQYIRLTLSEKISARSGEEVFGWETEHRDDWLRVPRKYSQLFIDEMTFCGSGWLALMGFWLLELKTPLLAMIFTVIEAVLLLVLAAWIWRYADVSKRSLGAL